jgi:hypothetical protein
MHEAGLRFLLRDPLGPVGRYIDAKARHVDQEAHSNAAGGGPGPRVRSTALFSSIRYGGLETGTDGNLVAYVISDARSPRQNFPYPLAMELGMPAAGKLPTFASGRTQRPYGPFPFLLPALRSAFPNAA